MKAVVYSKYGSPEVLQVKEVKKPVPKENEILVRVHATTVSIADCRLRKADPFAARFFFGLFRPKQEVLGGVLAGVVEAVGGNVQRFRVGDEVYVSTGMSFGAHAEYTCLAEDGLVAMKPSTVSYEEAVAVPFGAHTALYFLKKAKIQRGQKVLVYGASGAVGTAAVQVARHLGADVTGVCSTRNVELVRSLGCAQVVDYTREDFTERGEMYDVIFDTVGKVSFGRSKRVLRDQGVMILSAAGLGHMVRGAWTSMTSSKKVLTGVIKELAEDQVFLRGLMEAGELKSVIDRTYPLEQIADAHRYVEQGRKRGNVVIIV